MKVRVRHRAATTATPVEVFAIGPDQPLRLRDLRTAIATALHLPLPLRLSLNNRDELPMADDDDTLDKLKICGGDLLYVLTDAPVAVTAAAAASSVTNEDATKKAKAQTKAASPLDTAAAAANTGHSKPTYWTASRTPDLLAETYHAAAPRTAHEALAVVLHVLMLESGFVPLPGTALPPFWRHDTMPLMTLRYATPTGSPPAVIKCVGMSHLLIVHGAIEGDEHLHIYQTQLPVATYVRLHVPLSTNDCSRVYQNLYALVRVLKDHVVHRLHARANAMVGRMLSSTFEGLLPELKLVIFSWVDLQTLGRVACVNREFNQISLDQSLWKRLCLQQMDVTALPATPPTSWRTLLQQFVLQRRRERENIDIMRRHVVVQPPFQFPGANPYAPPVGGPSSMWGGDYDRFPNVRPMPGSLPFFPSQPGGGSGLRDPSPLGFPPGSIVPGARFDPVGPFGPMIPGPTQPRGFHPDLDDPFSNPGGLGGSRGRRPGIPGNNNPFRFI